MIIIGHSSSQYDPDVGCADPNRMRDKRILELKAKHNYYVMPTFNSNNLRLNTKKYQNEFDNETLTLYSGGGYIAKSRLGSSYSKRKRTLFGSSKRSTKYRSKRVPKRFNEQLDAASQRSVHSRRALSRGQAATRSVQMPQQPITRPMTGKLSHIDKESIKNQIIEQIERMSKDEVDKMSKKVDEITKDGDHEAQNANNQPDHNVQADPEFEREDFDTLNVGAKTQDVNDPHNESHVIEQEVQDVVPDLVKTANLDPANDYNDKGSRRTKIRSRFSRSSKRSSKSYISKLKEELDKEKAERVKLESEIEELKKISSEISSKLGINNA